MLLIDTGDLRSESSEIFTVLFLSHLWTTVTSLDVPDAENYVTNVIIEESAPITRTRIVYNQSGDESATSRGNGSSTEATQTQQATTTAGEDASSGGNDAPSTASDSTQFSDQPASSSQSGQPGAPGENSTAFGSASSQMESDEDATDSSMDRTTAEASEAEDAESESDDDDEKPMVSLTEIPRIHEDMDDETIENLYEYLGAEFADDEQPIEDAVPNWTGVSGVLFIVLLIRAYDNKIEDYTIGDTMEEFPVASDVKESLKDMSYIKELNLGNLDQFQSVYYLPTKTALSAAYETLDYGEGVGDIGESALHRLMTYLTARYYQSHPDIDFDVRIYVGAESLSGWESEEEDKPDVYDVVAEGGLTTTDHVAEIELKRNENSVTSDSEGESDSTTDDGASNSQILTAEKVIPDLAKLSKTKGKSVWVFEDKDARHQFVEILTGERPNKSLKHHVEKYVDDEDTKQRFLEQIEQNDGKLIEPITDYKETSSENLAKQMDVPGVDRIRTISDIYDDLVDNGGVLY